MDYIRHRPAPPLSDFVDFLWCLSDGPNHLTERILPGGTTELVINLRDNGISVAALHSHLIDETPRLYFMHFWGVGPATQLATGLRAAVNVTNLQR